MTPVFVVLANSIDASTRDSVQEFVKKNSAGWWHHFPDAWIVRGNSAEYWRSGVGDIVKAGVGTAVLVIQLANMAPTPAWAAWHKEDVNDLTAWLETHFRKG